MSRPPDSRRPVYLFVDEASIFPSVSLIRGLSEGGKYGLRTYVANQTASQLDPELTDALLANAGRIAFRLGLRDAHVLAPLMGVSPADLASLPDLRAIVQGADGAAFTTHLDPPSSLPEPREYVPPPLLDALRSRPEEPAALFKEAAHDPSPSGLWPQIRARLEGRADIPHEVRTDGVERAWLCGNTLFVDVEGELLRSWINDYDRRSRSSTPVLVRGAQLGSALQDLGTNDQVPQGRVASILARGGQVRGQSRMVKPEPNMATNGQDAREAGAAGWGLAQSPRKRSLPPGSGSRSAPRTVPVGAKPGPSTSI